jgi:hypothetical protein
MCFEFEALYWAKLAEEEENRKAEQDRKAAEQQRRSSDASTQPGYDEEPLPI